MSDPQPAEGIGESTPVDVGRVTDAELTVNDNAAVDALAAESEGKLEINAGDGASFDEFEALEAYESRSKEMSGQTEEKKEEPSQEDQVEAQGDGEEEKKEEAPEEEKKADSEESPEEVSAKSEGEEDEKAEGTGKTFEVEVDGKTVELSADTPFKVKVDGQEEEVSLQEALNSFSGHKAVARKFTQLNQERQKFLAEKKTIDQNIEEVFMLANQGEPEKALIKFFTALGVDPVKNMETLHSSFAQQAEQLATMTPEERRAHEAENRANLYKEQLESATNQASNIQQQQDIKNKIVDLQKTHNVDNETFDKIALELVDLKRQGKLQQDVTPELIIETALYDRKYDSATSILNNISADVAIEENVNAVMAMLQSGVSEEDVRVFAQGKWGQANPAQVISDKVRKTQDVEAKKKSAPVSPQNQDVWDFDQLGY